MEFNMIAGMLIGLAISAPVGPVNLLALRNAMRDGLRSGLASGFGVIVADCIYGAAAVMGVSAVIAFIMEYRGVLAFLGGLVLLPIGWRLSRQPAPELRVIDTTTSLVGHFSTLFGLTIANPQTMLGMAALLTALSHLYEVGTLTQAVQLVLGIFLGGALWWTGIVLVVVHYRERLSAKTWQHINQFTGIAIMAAGGLLIVSVL